MKLEKTLEFIKSTKNTHCFQEVDGIDRWYIQKTDMPELVKEIKITIEWEE